jgi:NADPH:quinone reductase-like Zn-dependent oxidoreductase
MRAITVSEPGGPDVLHLTETGIPQLRAGEVLVRVLAAGVGPWDVSLRSGRFPHEMPYIPGGEFAGTIVGDTGDDVSFDDGAPVYGCTGLTGSYAEYVACPAEQLAPIPAGLDAADAAAVPVDALTAHQGLTDQLGIGSGDTVLITAAAGGLGHFAVQMARGLGASVIATASKQHHTFVHALGAAMVVDHMQPDWPEQVRALTDGGATRVLACAGPTLAGAALAARDGAVIATPVHGDDSQDTGRVQWLRYDGQPRGSGLIALAPWFDDGSLAVHVAHRFFWQDAEAAHRAAEKGHTAGKLVLIVDEDLAARTGV